MNTADILGRDPAAIEAEIHRTRHSLDRKIEELERRFSPRYRWNQLRAGFDGAPMASWGAVAAVATGAWLAISGLRRYRFTSDGEALNDPADMMGE
jgi:hypothetical protein